jgi:outer membrane protein assembly factor BamA
LWGLDWNFLASVFYEEAERESFSLVRRAAVLQLSRENTPNITHLFSFNVENIDLNDVKVSEYLIPLRDREVNITSLSSTIILDYRNDPFNPTDGFFLSSNVKWAFNLFSKDKTFLKGYFQSSFYLPLFGDAILALGFRLGVSTGDLPASDRFFAGGSSTLRSYPLDSVGPKDEETGYPTGGNGFMITNGEVRLPVFGSLGLVLFYDVGSAYENSVDISLVDLSHSVGIGVRYNTPVGPLRVDFGLNPNNPEENQIFFSIGHAFE